MLNNIPLDFDNLVIGFRYDLINVHGEFYQLYFTGCYGSNNRKVVTFSEDLKKIDCKLQVYKDAFLKYYRVYELNSYLNKIQYCNNLFNHNV